MQHALTPSQHIIAQLLMIYLPLTDEDTVDILKLQGINNILSQIEERGT